MATTAGAEACCNRRGRRNSCFPSCFNPSVVFDHDDHEPPREMPSRDRFRARTQRKRVAFKEISRDGVAGGVVEGAPPEGSPAACSHKRNSEKIRGRQHGVHDSEVKVEDNGLQHWLFCTRVTKAQIEIVQILDGTSGNVPDIFSLFEPISKEYFHEQMFKEEAGTMAGFYDSILSSGFVTMKAVLIYLSMAQEISKYRFDTLSSNLKQMYHAFNSDNKDDISGDLKPSTERLQPLQSLLQDAQCKVEELSIESHPSLHVIENILRHVSASFPFNMFTNILEYGGPRSKSIISEIFTSLPGFPRLHFIELDIGSHELAKAFCEGFDSSRNPVISMEGIAEYISQLQWCLNDEKCERPFSPSPVNKASSSSVQKKEVFHDEQIINLMHFPTSKETTVKGSSAPEVLIIVNTQNHEKNMIMSRRSSYQKILALENGDVQVVERDIDLPLDLICSAAVCLVWYEARNVEKTDAAVKLSEVPSFVENIATKILMSLSYSFSGCILIFEGESKFLASIMESSDMLYAAAASLELNLQLFCSHMPDSTDEIILNCIKTIGIIDRGLYPAMPESESISESFLTRFPSLNPLSAHAILSSGGILVEFLEWSPECRIKAIGKYKMPAESICLFNALCRYGEFGESKSVMTDCSSIGSDNSGVSLQSNRKRQRYMASSRKPDTLLDESFYVGKVPSNHIGSGAPQTSRPYLSNNFKFHGVPERAQFFNDPEIIDSKLEVNNSKIDNLGRNFFSQHAEHDGKFDLDAIDHSSSFSNEQSSSIPSSGFNIRSSELSKQEVESFYPPGRSSFRQISTFPTSLEINFGEKDRTCFDQNINFIQSVKAKFGLIDKEVSAEKADILHENVSDALDPTCRNRIPYLGDIYLANMNQPSQEQNSRKYKIEFLDRVNKRSRMQQQSPWNTSQIRPGSSKKQISLQKKSPSIIDTFRYRGNKQVNTTSNKCNNFARTKSGPRDLEKKDSALITPTWTPIDKRARQHLFFMRTGNEKQSRLVWRRRDSPSVGGNLRKRKRDEF
ncbi:hypothetical protein HPP92_008396 [Vanilla planifolia]|uniref:Protein SHORTAGE IN CHIASMATA 1 n=1 Tax=Vanilla planifolia TaxID=51239 RepID=A0A835RBV9_VANPL|nr:hypothetical protein HPP92_008396 [Vanilla planifolia]